MNRKKHAVWLKMEYKRAAFMLPFILKKAIILITVCLAAVGVIAFCIKSLQGTQSDTQKLRIGYVAEENMLTDFAIAYIQNMESVQSLCSLESVSEQEGRKLLNEGELSALIVLPQDVINEILSGRNTPARLYLPAGDSAGGLYAVGTMLFEELASAGMGMLATAQAEIYAVSVILEEMTRDYDAGSSVTGDFVQTMYDDINRFNLSIATKREDLFHIENLSVTGTDTYAVYYGSALFTIYILLAGLFIGSFCKRTSIQQTMTAKRIGVGYAAQLLDRCLAGGALLFLTTLLPLALLFVPAIRDLVTVKLTIRGSISLILVIMFAAVYHMFWYQLVEKQESAVVVIGISALLQAYASGCLIPAVLLPEAINKAGALLPAAFIKAGFTAFLTGETRQLPHVAKGLLIWSLILFAVTLGLIRTGERKQSELRHKKMHSHMHVPSLCMVLLRRLLHKKSIWLCMGLTVALSMVIAGAEKRSKTQIQVGVCDESGDYAALLEAYDGLVRFEIFDDMQQLQKAVLAGDIECGYLLPEDLTEDIITRRANRSVRVYQDVDAVAVPIVNEVLFERIFRQVSLRWYEDYIAQNSVIASLGADTQALRQKVEDSFERQLTAGTTFGFEMERIGTVTVSDAAGEENEMTYPVRMVVIITILLCVLQGIVQVIIDTKNQRFYKRNRAVMSVLTMMLPVLLGLLAGFLVIITNGSD